MVCLLLQSGALLLPRVSSGHGDGHAPGTRPLGFHLSAANTLIERPELSVTSLSTLHLLIGLTESLCPVAPPPPLHRRCHRPRPTPTLPSASPAAPGPAHQQQTTGVKRSQTFAVCFPVFFFCLTKQFYDGNGFWGRWRRWGRGLGGHLLCAASHRCCDQNPLSPRSLFSLNVAEVDSNVHW